MSLAVSTSLEPTVPLSYLWISPQASAKAKQSSIDPEWEAAKKRRGELSKIRVAKLAAELQERDAASQRKHSTDPQRDSPSIDNEPLRSSCASSRTTLTGGDLGEGDRVHYGGFVDDEDELAAAPATASAGRGVVGPLGRKVMVKLNGKASSQGKRAHDLT